MLFLATVEAGNGVHFVQLARGAGGGYTRFDVDTRPRPARGATLAVELAGLAAPTRDGFDAWRARNAPPPTGLPRPCYRAAALGDLLTAINADAFMSLAREASADQLAAFARDRGGALLAELRRELARPDGGAPDPAALRERARRFATVLNVAYRDDAFAELDALHPIEQLMGLEHAVARWIEDAAEPLPDRLALLRAELPEDDASAGASRAWFLWWWRLGHRAPRAGLKAAVAAVVELARAQCGVDSGADRAARATCDEAARMLDHLRVASVARLWADPPEHAKFGADGLGVAIDRDFGDAHFCAYMAVTHAAHAYAAVLRERGYPAADANRRALAALAARAVEAIT